MYLRYRFAVFFLVATIPLLLFAADEKDKKSADSSADKKSADSSADKKSAGSSADKKRAGSSADKKSAGSSADKKSAGSSTEAFIKNHAAKEFAHSKDQVSVKDIGVINGKQEYEVSAAGQTVRYRFAKGNIHTTTIGDITVCVCCYTRRDGTCGCYDCHTVKMQ